VKRPLAPLVLEQKCSLAVVGLSSLTAPFVANEGNHPTLEVIDVVLIAAVAALMVWWLGRLRRHKLAGAPSVPPNARIDSGRKTIVLAVVQGALVFVLLLVGAYGAGPGIPILLAAVTLILAWHTRELQRWERRTGSRAFRERRVFARGTPLFYRSLTPGSGSIR
jgi:hypothetical protein